MRFRYLRGRLAFLLALAGVVSATVWLAIYLPRLLAPVAILERAFSLAAAGAVFVSDDFEENKLSKFCLLLLPWLGAAILLLPRGRKSAALPLRKSRARSVRYFSTGREMYESLLRDLSRAKERIYLEYYIIASGVFWNDVYAAIKERAACGVDVRLIYDDFGCLFTRRRAFVREAEAQGVKTARFRPLRVGKNAGKRDHRKIAVVDGAVYTGGINLADEYIGETIRFGHWKDTAVRAEGDVSDDFAELFLRTYCAIRRDTMPALPRKHADMPPSHCNCVAVSDGANGEERTGAVLLPFLVSRAREKIYLFTPYLAPDAALVSALAFAAKRGADVRLMIPHIPDKKWVFFLTRSYADSLASAGVQVREYGAGFLHAKCALFDRTAFVSSYNLDFRSLYLQAECGLVFGGGAAEDVERDFLSTWEQGVPLKTPSRAGRALGRLCRVFAPLI